MSALNLIYSTLDLSFLHKSSCLQTNLYTAAEAAYTYMKNSILNKFYCYLTHIFVLFTFTDKTFYFSDNSNHFC